MLKRSNKEQELFKSKVLAQSLFGVAVVAFLVCTFLGDSFWWTAFLRATAEAAMVGAIADWFAVTALFRYPLGIKFPHTAIIPNKKNEIGNALATFISEKFMVEEVISERLQSMEMTKRIAEWVVEPDNSSWVAAQVSVGVAGVMTVIKDEDIQVQVESKLAEEIRARDIAPLIGKFLLLVTTKDRQRKILHLLLEKGQEFLRANRKIIVPIIYNTLPWIFRVGGIERVYRRFVDAIDAILAEMSVNRNHPLNGQFDTYVRKFVFDLQHSEDIKIKERAIKEDLLKEGDLYEFAGSLWMDIKANLLEFDPRANNERHRFVQKQISDLGHAILSDEVLLRKMDRWLNQAVVYSVKNYGYEIEGLISNTMENWDPGKVSQEIELQIGKDLQYIRVNGTVVGGLIGFTIYSFHCLVDLL